MESKLFLFDPKNIKEVHHAVKKISNPKKIVTDARWTDQYAWAEESGIPEWEQRVSIMYPSIEYDNSRNIYRLWYYAQWKDSPIEARQWTKQIIDKYNTNNVELEGFNNTANGVIRPGKDLICYMESSDGINWERPGLGEFFFKTRSGDIVETNIVSIGMHGQGVHRNENPDKNEPAYLIAGRTWETDSLDHRGEPIGVAISWSENGIHWEEPVTIKTAYDCDPDIHNIRADTQNQLLWSKELGRYIVITRGYTKDKYPLRLVAFMESTYELPSLRDLARIKKESGEKYWTETSKYWSRPTTVLDHDVKASAQPYSMPVTHLTDGLYIGLLSVANLDKSSDGIWNSVHTELTYSNDGKSWYYIDKGNPFINNADHFELTPGNDYGMIYGSAPVTVGNNTCFFYAAIPELHYFYYKDIPANIVEIIDERIPEAAKTRQITRSTTMNIAAIGKDRYAGYYSDEGYITVAPVIITGNSLFLTADVKEEGFVKVEILDEFGNIISGYEKDKCNKLTSDTTDGIITWESSDISPLINKKVSFRIYLRKAIIYTVSGNFEKLG